LETISIATTALAMIPGLIADVTSSDFSVVADDRVLVVPADIVVVPAKNNSVTKHFLSTHIVAI